MTTELHQQPRQCDVFDAMVEAMLGDSVGWIRKERVRQGWASRQLMYKRTVDEDGVPVGQPDVSKIDIGGYDAG